MSLNICHWLTNLPGTDAAALTYQKQKKSALKLNMLLLHWTKTGQSRGESQCASVLCSVYSFDNLIWISCNQLEYQNKDPALAHSHVGKEMSISNECLLTAHIVVMIGREVGTAPLFWEVWLCRGYMPTWLGMWWPLLPREVWSQKWPYASSAITVMFLLGASVEGNISI